MDHSSGAAQAAKQRAVRTKTQDAAESQKAEKLEREKKKRFAIMARVQEIVESQTPTQRDADKKLFRSWLTDDVLRSEFAQRGWRAALCLPQMVEFWEDFQPGCFESVE